MNRRDNVREFRRLDGAIATNEREAEAWKWRQAELAAEAIDAGMTQREYAADVEKSQSHVWRLVQIGRHDYRGNQRPRFADAYASTQTGQATSKAQLAQRERERQVPTRHEDRVEMAEKLLADPEVAKEAVGAVLAEPSKSQRIVERAVKQKASDERRQSIASTRRQAEAEALPLPAYMVEMVAKMQEFALGLAGLYDVLDELPEGHGRELIAEATQALVDQGQRWLDKLNPARPDLVVIEGRRSA